MRARIDGRRGWPRRAAAQGSGWPPRPRLADDLDAAVRLEQPAQAMADDLVIVEQETVITPTSPLSPIPTTGAPRSIAGRLVLAQRDVASALLVSIVASLLVRPGVRTGRLKP